VLARTGETVARALAPPQGDPRTVAAAESPALDGIAPPGAREGALDVDAELCDLRRQLERL
jgi:hypothetical protein